MSHEKNIALIDILNTCATECSHCAMAACWLAGIFTTEAAGASPSKKDQ